MTNDAAVATAASLSLYFLTFNCARTLVEPEALGAYLFQALPRPSPSPKPTGNDAFQDGTAGPRATASSSASFSTPEHIALPDVLVLSLQEIAPVAESFLGGSHLEPYLERIRRAVDYAVSRAVDDNDISTANPEIQSDEESDGNTDRSARRPQSEHSTREENTHLLRRHRAKVAKHDASSRPIYKNIIVRNVGMTALMIFMREDQIDRIAHIHTAGVGLGLWGMGNKGAVGVKLGLLPSPPPAGRGTQEDYANVTEVAFVAAHLAPMEDGLSSRNEDWNNIARGLVFTPLRENALRYIKGQKPIRDHSSATTRHTVSTPSGAHSAEAEAERTRPVQADEAEPLLHDSVAEDDNDNHNSNVPLYSGLYSPSTSYVFFGGDLNYRTSDRGPSPDDHKLYPQPTSDQTSKMHFSHLLANDQLTREMKAGHVLQGFREARITFPPTYKYSSKQPALVPDEALDQWAWSPHRWPSWCDRILVFDGGLNAHSGSTAPSSSSSSSPSSPDITLPTNKYSHVYTALPVMPTSDHRPVALSINVPLRPEVRRAEALSRDDGLSGEDDLRVSPPLEMDPLWREKRSAGRRKELAVGVLAYLGLTWEGNGLLLATIIGAVGGWLLLRSVLAG
ncbi:DNase I-like protein [Xylona heveae TC161]|uniref:DNase I-like protein n=1 Tax=Xylona heveae (strain CBS 132557 / TC161) TaxID=1328760 RepID=A0A165H5K7_XYLHT|nr:DNase I-like protein [Xylona heveae TC161]KZF23016.1 DNase I-like protein [Xylona heveae TC161]